MNNRNRHFIDFLKSLKFRLILLLVVVTVIPCAIVSTIIVSTYEERAKSIRESEVLGQAKILANSIATSEYFEKTSSDLDRINAQIDMLTSIYSGRVMVVNKDFMIVTDTYNIDDNNLLVSQDVISCFQGNEISPSYDKENGYIEMTVPIINPNDKKGLIKGVIVASVSTDNISLNKAYIFQIAILSVVMLSAVALFLGILAIINMVKPLKRISDGIEDVKGGYGEDTLNVDDFSETKVICDHFNTMLSSMRVMDESRQEFVSNVSHELKTPLTSMKVLADSINSMPDAPVELYQEFMGDITNEIERETKIINDLLSLVKMDKSAVTLNIESININDLLEQIMKRVQPIADKQKVELVLESFRPVVCDVDEVKISLALTNLIENAVKYNRDDGEGWVHVSLNADHQYMYIKVEDSGIGIPEESLEHIYERFYRVDKSHSREIGGTGLGLAITRNSILMHKGAIKVHSVL